MCMFHTRDTLKVNEKGHLEIGGADCTELAAQFGTPLYVFDEAYIRQMMRVYRDTIEEEYDGNGLVLYASKAFSCEAMYAVADSEGLGADVVSGGELYTAMQAGFPAKKIVMHGNNKLPYELSYALDCGVGTIVVDAAAEADFLDSIAGKREIVQDVLIRINPGVEAHTHAYVQTATPDSKFGFSVAGGAAEEIVRYVLQKKNLRLRGFHCHIGSQIFEKQSFVIAAQKVLAFVAEMKEKTGFEADTVNLGGGFGIWYAEGDPMIAPAGYREYLSALIAAVREGCAAYGLRLPRLMLEPGRSVVGEAGITLYTVGNIKNIPGIRKYLAVDGGLCSQTVRTRSRRRSWRSRASAVRAAISSGRSSTFPRRNRATSLPFFRRARTTIRWRPTITATLSRPPCSSKRGERSISCVRRRTKISSGTM